MMCRRTTFRSYFVARLLLCLFLLAQSSMALAAPSSLPDRIGRTSPATSASTSPALAGSHSSTTPSANAPAANCTPNDCAIYLPWIAAGTPPKSTPISDAEPPSAPSNLRATGKTVSSVSLAWDAAADNIAVTAYVLYSSSTLVLTTTSLSATISALTANTTYTFTVAARDTAGNLSAASAQLSVTTNAVRQSEAPDTHAPTTPAHLRAIGKTHGTIALAWDPSSDDVAVAEYDLYDHGIWLTRTTDTRFTVTHLAAVSGHVFTVEAYDSSGKHETKIQKSD